MTTQRLPLGTFVGARSGDKGGDANVGAWVVDPVEAAAVVLAHGGEAPLEVPEAADRARGRPIRVAADRAHRGRRAGAAARDTRTSRSRSTRSRT